MAQAVKNKNSYALYAVAVVAIIAVAAIGFYFLQPKMVEGKLNVEWNMGESPTGASADIPSAVEITAYQSSVTMPVWRYYGFAEYDTGAGIGLVKEIRQASLPSGLVTLSLKSEAAHIDPTTITVKDIGNPSTQLLEQNYEYDTVTQARLLQKYVGEQIAVVTDNETISGTLLNADNGITLQTSYGVTSINSYKRIIFPTLPAGLRSTPTLELLLDVKNAGNHQLEVSYLTSGINWEANYVATVSSDDTRADVNAVVNVRNDAGATYRNAKLKLVAGTINLASRDNYYPSYAKAMVAESAGAAPSSQFSQQTLGEYHLYALDRTVTLNSGEQKQLSLFSAPSVAAKKELVFDPDQSSSVQYKIEFENKKESGLGLAMPAGKVRVFKPDSTGQMQFLGEDTIEHTPDGEKVRLRVGNSFDVTGQRTQTSTDSLGDCADQNAYKVVLKNAKTTDETVTVVERAWGDVKVVEENMPHTAESATKFTWSVPVKAGSSATLTYKLLQRWC